MKWENLKCKLQIATLCLIQFDGFEESFEISGSEPLKKKIS